MFAEAILGGLEYPAGTKRTALLDQESCAYLDLFQAVCREDS
jgi:hypothetical protein